MASEHRKKFTFEWDDITLALNQASTDQRNLVWKQWYDSLISQLATSEYRFINYGYLSSIDTPIDPAEERIRNFIGLYQRTLGDIDLTDKDVLDVSAGLGGGALWISRNYNPASLVAIDLSTEAVDLCNRWYSEQRNLKFIAGDAEELPFSDDSFDVIYNVESSHCYTNIDAFLAEMNRVLKPGGCFFWSDFQSRGSLEEIRSGFVSAGFKTVNFEDITDGVIRSLEYVRGGISDGTLDSNLFIWGGDTDCIQDVIGEFSDWRSYHRCRVSLDG
jgi:SAM-dependent methyltransferase